MRSIVLCVVAMMAFVLLFPTVRAYFAQSADLQAMRASVADAAARNEELEYQLRRWDDPSFVASQARERLAYVYPGETAYRVLDPESVETAVNPDTGKAETKGPIDVGFADTPWYATVWNSLEVAGTVDVARENAAPTPTAPGGAPDGASGDGPDDGADAG